MKKRMLSILLCLCMAVGLLAGLASTAGAYVAVTGIQTAGVTRIGVGAATKWTASVVPANATDKFLWWTAGNPGVATVDQNGNIKALRAGQCNITVTAKNGVKKTVLLTVVGGDVPVTGIQTAGKTRIAVGETTRWTASVLPANATNKSLTWAAGNPGVATVDQNGNITAHKPGQCHISVTASNGVKKTVMLTVTELSGKNLKTGTCGENLRWALDAAGKLTIYGSGPMEDRLIVEELLLWGGEGKRIKTVVICNGVTTIGECAFFACKNLTGITIPNSVTSIGAFAFNYCERLTKISIPESVTNIEWHAFDYCKSLALHEYDNGLYLGNSANPYYALIKTKYTSISSCFIHNQTNVIAGYAFGECKWLTSVAIPDKVRTIGTFAFIRCKNLTSITIPGSVTRIGNRAFEDCRSLKSVVYKGTPAQWSKIVIDDGNDLLKNASRQYQ